MRKITKKGKKKLSSYRVLSNFEIGFPLFARLILKLLAWLFPELYSTQFNYYYLF